MGEAPGDDVTVMGLAGTGTFTPSEEEPALPATGIGETGGSANCGVLGGDSNCASNSRIKDEDADEGEENVLAILNAC